MTELRKIPGVDILLNTPEVVELISETNLDLVKYTIRTLLNVIKVNAEAGASVPDKLSIVNNVVSETHKIYQKSLKNIINCTGIIVHTNLGRAPFGEEFLSESIESLKGYNNLEYDLNVANRGSRNVHGSELLKFLTGAEDVLVVNNNAAAVMLILRTFAKNKEVIVSRGELIEIGGSFRIPEIMAASDCKMIEVGTTNKTKVTDYKKSITDNSAVLFKAHKSNYSIEGFTQEVSLSELVNLGKRADIPVVYDMGSGLLDKKSIEQFKDEPDVKQTLKSGVDLVCFSGDKLLGGPQAGIIAGKKILISKLKKEPMLRALRVDKISLSFLETACGYYLKDKILFEKNQLYKTLDQKKDELRKKADILNEFLDKQNISSEIVETQGQFGGGALPGKVIPSYALVLRTKNASNKTRSVFAEKMYFGLLHCSNPVLGVLKKGNIYFDILTIHKKEINKLAESICEVYKRVTE